MPAKPADRYRLRYAYAFVAIYDTARSVYVWSTDCPHEERNQWLEHADTLITRWQSTPTFDPPLDPRMNDKPPTEPAPHVPTVGDTGTATIFSKEHPKGIDREARILEVHGPILVVTHRDPKPGSSSPRWLPRATIKAEHFKANP